MSGKKNCYPACPLCEGCGEITKVLIGSKWHMVPATEAGEYERRVRTIECPNARHAGSTLELPLIEIE